MPGGSIGSGVFYLVLTTSRRLMLCFFLCRRLINGFSVVMRSSRSCDSSSFPTSIIISLCEP